MDKKETEASQEVPLQTLYSIVGKSRTVYMDEPPKAEAQKPAASVFRETSATRPVESVEPVFSEDLQPVPAFEEEPGITAAEVDANLNEDDLSAEDRFLPLDTAEDSQSVSTGMTYDQLSLAIEAVKGKKMSDADRLAAARTLYEVQGSDIFDFLAMQAENETAIERLLKENLDDKGAVATENRVAKRQITVAFDMEKYV